MSLNVSNLTVHHGAIRAISQVSIAVPTGKLAAIIGSNGAGKTTLLRTLSGLKNPTNGSIMWKGEKIVGIKPEALVRRGISHVSKLSRLSMALVLASLSVSFMVRYAFRIYL